MTREELVAGLHGMQTPDAVGLWPPAPGWWWLGGGLLLAPPLAVGLARLHARRRPRRRALRKLRGLHAAPPADDGERARELARINELLRELTLALAPLAAGRVGLAWLHALDNALEPGVFTRGAGRCLLDGPYRAAVPPDEVDREALFRLVGRWIRRARAEDM